MFDSKLKGQYYKVTFKDELNNEFSIISASLIYKLLSKLNE